jgi:hypothetical protein
VTKVNVFDASLDAGKRAERILDIHYSQKYEVLPVSIRTEKADKIDRVLVCRSTRTTTMIEYKLDRRCITTGNGFIDLMDQDGKPSWGLIGKADLITMLLAGWDQALEMPGPVLRREAIKWASEFPRKTVTEPGRHEILTVEGVAVPIGRLNAIASDRIFLPMAVSVN